MKKSKIATSFLSIAWLLAGVNAQATCTSTITNTSTSSTTTLGSNSDGACAENSGSITTSDSSAFGLFSFGDNSTNTNSGSITTSGSTALGLYSVGDNSTNTNSGSITTSGSSALGLFSFGDNSTNTNSGSITTSGALAYGIRSDGANSNINNSGTIRATNANSAAIYLESTATNNTVNLNRGSIIVGDIKNNGATGAKLNINLGSGTSYAYSVTGAWTVADLDNRPMVIGSAYAAGIGAQETASQMLYQRTSALTSSLDNRLYAALDKSNTQPYWLDVYYSDVSRDAGANYSTRTKFSNNNYGVTVGVKLPAEITPLELIINAEHSKLNIDNASQKVNSTSVMVGVLAPKVTEIAGAQLSAKALLGYADHDGDRKVMTNSLLYDGSRQITSNYSSVYGVVGAALIKPYAITDQLTSEVLVGVDLTAERVGSYRESDYFSWNQRTLTQFQSRIQAGLNYRFSDNKSNLFARLGLERRDLVSGATQDYTINNTSVSFNTSNQNDAYVTAQIGARIQLEKHIQLFSVLSGLRSSDTVRNVQVNIGLRVGF